MARRAVGHQIIGLSQGSTVVNYAAPTIAEAAPGLLGTLPLWETSPQPEQTAFSVLSDTLADAVAGKADSDSLDRNILDEIRGLDRIFDLGFESLSILNGKPDAVRLRRPDLATVDRLRRTAPPEERTIVTGYLDELSHSKRSFVLRVPGGKSLRGIFPEGLVDVVGALWAKRVTVDGEVTYRPSGEALVIHATHIQLAGEKDAAWERVPTATAVSIEDFLRSARPSVPGGYRGLMGTWPGDETDEEIAAALEELERE